MYDDHETLRKSIYHRPWLSTDGGVDVYHTLGSEFWLVPQAYTFALSSAGSNTCLHVLASRMLTVSNLQWQSSIVTTLLSMEAQLLGCCADIACVIKSASQRLQN